MIIKLNEMKMKMKRIPLCASGGGKTADRATKGSAEGADEVNVCRIKDVNDSESMKNTL
jgi:hypothetical protein